MEMKTFKEEWETVLDDLEAESALLLVCFFLPFFFHCTLDNLLYFGTKTMYYFTQQQREQTDKNTLQGQRAHAHQ